MATIMSPIEEATRTLRGLKATQAIVNTQLEMAVLRLKKLRMFNEPDYDLKEIIIIEKQLLSLQQTFQALLRIQEELVFSKA